MQRYNILLQAMVFADAVPAESIAPKGTGLLLSWRSAHSACSWSVSSTKAKPLLLADFAFASPALSASFRIFTCFTVGSAFDALSLTCMAGKDLQLPVQQRQSLA